MAHLQELADAVKAISAELEETKKTERALSEQRKALLWKMLREHKLTQRRIGELVGMQQPRIAQILGRTRTYKLINWTPESEPDLPTEKTG